MITTRLMGGLGNQMFQYAAGRRLALRHGVELAVDLGWFGNESPGDTPRTYELGVLAADARARKVHRREREPRGRAGLALKLARDRLPSRETVLRETSHSLDRRVLEAGPRTTLVGYWQSEGYFADVAGVIREELALADGFTAAEEALAREIAATPAASVHVRRGDYISNPAARAFHGAPADGYYERAAARILEHEPETTFWVFSDDPAWCREHLALPGPVRVVEGHRDAAELHLMARCEHHVIANSSFSWWGAWLGTHPDGLVIAPRRWHAPPRPDPTDVVPERWIRA